MKRNDGKYTVRAVYFWGLRLDVRVAWKVGGIFYIKK